MADRVELLVRAIEITREAQNLGEEYAAAKVGRVIAHLFDLRGEGFVELSLVKQVVSTHNVDPW